MRLSCLFVLSWSRIVFIRPSCFHVCRIVFNSFCRSHLPQLRTVTPSPDFSRLTNEEHWNNQIQGNECDKTESKYLRRASTTMVHWTYLKRCLHNFSCSCTTGYKLCRKTWLNSWCESKSNNDNIQLVMFWPATSQEFSRRLLSYPYSWSSDKNLSSWSTFASRPGATSSLWRNIWLGRDGVRIYFTSSPFEPTGHDTKFRY